MISCFSVIQSFIDIKVKYNKEISIDFYAINFRKDNEILDEEN